MMKLKSTYLAAAVAGLFVFAPAVSFAQPAPEIVAELRTQLIELGIGEADLANLDKATDAQIEELQTVVEGEGDEQQKKDQVAAVLAAIQ